MFKGSSNSKPQICSQKPQRFRLQEALAAKPLFANLRWGPPAVSGSFRLCKMPVFAALQPPFQADLELILELRICLRRSHYATPQSLHTRARSSAAAKAFRCAIVVRGGRYQWR